MRARRWIGWLAVMGIVLAGCAPAATPTPTTGPKPTVAPGVTPTRTPSPVATATRAPAATSTAAPVGPRVGGTIRWPTEQDPPSWDPSKTHVDASTTSKYLVFTKLFTFWSQPAKSCPTEVYANGIESWRWADDTTAEFTLRKGMKYQDRPPVNGREVVAADMVPSFARYQKNLAYMASQSNVVESVQATDKYTFRMKLKSPWGGLVTELFASNYGVWIEPSEAGGPDGSLWERPEKSWIGSGPFLFDSWQPGVKWRFVRNPSYWRPGLPYVEAVEYPIIPDVSTRLAAISSGQINVVRELPEQLLAVAEQRVAGAQVIRCPGPGVRGASFLWMNNSGAPFDNPLVRQAVSMAIDRQAIVDTIYIGKARIVGALPLATQYSVAPADLPAEVRQYLENNPDRARQLLAQAGYPSGFTTAINTTSGYPSPTQQIAEALSAMLSKVGIRASLNIMEYGRYTQTVLQAKYPVGEMAMSPRISVTPETGNSLEAFWSKSGSVNRSVVNDPEYDKLFQSFRASFDETQRKDLARQLQVMSVSKAYALSLPLTDTTLLTGPGVHVFYTIPGRDISLLMENIWMEK